MVSQYYNITINNRQELCVTGRIELSNVMQACASGKALIDMVSKVSVNLLGLEYADSSTLAMLVDWVRSAKVQHKDIVFYNVPQRVLDLSRVCGLDYILPIDKPLEFHS